MKARRWMMAGMLALLVSGRVAVAQNAGRMMVVINFAADKDPWVYATDIGSVTAMPLLGVSPSGHSAVYTVPNETNLATGAVAAKNQQIAMNRYPGVIAGYNYGVNMTVPADLQATRTSQPGRRGMGYGRGGRFGNQYRFTDQDRQAARDWYNQNQGLTTRLQVGTVLDPSLKSMSYVAPADLARRLAALPAGYRYVMVGGNLVLIDQRDMVQDVLQLEMR